MRDPVERIRQGFESTCFADRVNRGTCSVSMARGPQPQLLIDLDLPGSPLNDQSVRCDYLVFAGDGQPLFLVMPIEFKTKWRRKVVKQLQAGADEAKRHVADSLSARFRPITVLHRFWPKATRRELRESVAFGGRTEPIRMVMCGEDIGRVLGI